MHSLLDVDSGDDWPVPRGNRGLIEFLVIFGHWGSRVIGMGRRSHPQRCREMTMMGPIRIGAREIFGFG